MMFYDWRDSVMSVLQINKVVMVFYFMEDISSVKTLRQNTWNWGRLVLDIMQYMKQKKTILILFYVQV